MYVFKEQGVFIFNIRYGKGTAHPREVMPHYALALPDQMPSRSTICDKIFFLHPGISSPPLGKKSR